jgi:hypothetical protein
MRASALLWRAPFFRGREDLASCPHSRHDCSAHYRCVARLAAKPCSAVLEFPHGVLIPTALADCSNQQVSLRVSSNYLHRSVCAPPQRVPHCVAGIAPEGCIALSRLAFTAPKCSRNFRPLLTVPVGLGVGLVRHGNGVQIGSDGGRYFTAWYRCVRRCN